MTWQPYSLLRCPRRLPDWQTMLDDLANPSPTQIARVLGVGVRTVYRWNATGKVPLAARLAVFWLTQWGRSEANTAAVNDCALAAAWARALQAENTQLRHQLAQVLALSDTGAANEPLSTGPLQLAQRPLRPAMGAERPGVPQPRGPAPAVATDPGATPVRHRDRVGYGDVDKPGPSARSDGPATPPCRRSGDQPTPAQAPT